MEVIITLVIPIETVWTKLGNHEVVPGPCFGMLSLKTVNTEDVSPIRAI